MNKTITEIILIILICLWFISIFIISLEDLFKPKKYYKVEYCYGNRYVTRTIIKAKTPKQAIDKLIRKYQRDFPLNEVTDIINCIEIDFYKCLKEVSND